MIVSLPKNILSLNAEVFLPENEPIIKISPIKSGVLIYNVTGGLIGQVFVDGNKADIVIADGGALRVTCERNTEYIIRRPFRGNEVKQKIARPESEKTVNTEFSVFGKPYLGRYELFEKKPQDKLPVSVATVINAPLTEDTLKVKLDDRTNILRSLTIILALSMVKD